MAYTERVLDHGSTRPGRWLRDRRLRLTLSVAVVEGLLVVLHVLHWWTIVLLAAAAVAAWWYGGRRHRIDAVRQATWIAAASQLLVLCVPLVLTIATAIAIGIVALLAIAALIFLFTERA
jgi:hypothetical protein